MYTPRITTETPTIRALELRIAQLEEQNARLREENTNLKWNPNLHMLNRLGMRDAIRNLRGYVGVGFADGDSFKTLNNVRPDLGYGFADRLVRGFSDAFRQTSRDRADGQPGFPDQVLLGQKMDADEYIIIVPAGEIYGALRKLRCLMADQPLTDYERLRLRDLSNGTMSCFTATMCYLDAVAAEDVPTVVDQLASAVLRAKQAGRRDCILGLHEDL